MKRPNNERARRLTRKRAKRAEAHHKAKRDSRRRRWLARIGWRLRTRDRADIPKVEPVKEARNTGRNTPGSGAMARSSKRARRAR